MELESVLDLNLSEDEPESLWSLCGEDITLTGHVHVLEDSWDVLIQVALGRCSSQI